MQDGEREGELPVIPSAALDSGKIGIFSDQLQGRDKAASFFFPLFCHYAVAVSEALQGNQKDGERAGGRTQGTVRGILYKNIRKNRSILSCDIRKEMIYLDHSGRRESAVSKER